MPTPISRTGHAHPHATPVALITGGTAGIGLAIATALAQRGWSLVLVARNPERLADAAEQLRPLFPPGSEPDILTHPADLAQPGAAEGMIAIAAERFGRLDALINNAGIAPLKPIAETTDADLDACLAINLRSPLIAIREAWPLLQSSADLPNAPAAGSAIINISTMGTLDPFPGFYAYAATKAGMNLATRSIANEPDNQAEDLRIRAFTIAPGAVETAMLRTLFPPDQLPESVCLTPENIAELAMQCLEDQRPEDHGQTLYITRDDNAQINITTR